MVSEVSKGIIYRIIKYSDRSAICFGFTEKRGKLKFFVSNAFGKNRSIQKIFPSEITYVYKETTDLHKILSIEYLTDYSFFQSETPLYLRLNLLFEVLDAVLPIGASVDELWRYISNLKRDNYLKGVSFIVFYLLEMVGFLTRGSCALCGANVEDSFVCANCFKQKNLSNISEFLMRIEDKGSFKQFKFDNDIPILDFFSVILKKHDINLKSLEMIKRLDF